MSARSIPLHLRVDGPSVKQIALFDGIGRTFAPYQQWEDYRAGMYGGRMTDEGTEAARRILSRTDECRAAMLRVVREWPTAAAVNLSNTGLNQKAWLGQAACCLVAGSTANETKRAWWLLSEAERLRANACAYEVIALWQTDRL